VLAAEHLLDFAGLHFLREGIERLRELGVDRFTGFRPLDQHRQVVAFFGEGHDEIAVLLQATATLEHFLGVGLVLAGVGSGGPSFEARQFFVRV
jgi:hypothetical protein